MHDDDWFTLAELTDRLGGLIWVEERLSHVLGAWSRVESNSAIAVVFATTGRHHEWHGEVLRRCLATSPQLLEAEVVRPPTAGWERVVATLGGVLDPDATAVRLRALAKVVDPWLARETAALIELSRPVSDAAMMRWLRFVEIDHSDDSSAAAELAAARTSAPARLDDHIIVNDLDLS